MTLIQDDIAVPAPAATGGLCAEHMVLWLAFAWTIVRLLYLVWLSPWDLLGDEAYYWIQGQHLALSYAEKGPLLAWGLWLSHALFGWHEWVVRFPVLLGSGVALWAVGRVTTLVDRSNRLSAVLAIAAFVLTPALVANGQICTQDGLLIPWFTILGWIGIHLVRRWESNAPAWTHCILFYGVLGVGMLLKQSILLFLSALVVYAIVRRKRLRWTKTLFFQQLVGLLVIGLCCLPMIVWDAQHGWPLVRHTLQHLGAAEGGFASRNKGNAAIWLGNTLVGLLGSGGPALVLMGWASIDAYRHRTDDDALWRDQLWLICTAWPSILFFVALSFTKPVVPSWPLPSIVTLVPLAGIFLARRLPRERSSREMTDGISPHARKRTAAELLWGGTLWYGGIALVLLSFPTLVRLLPLAGPQLDRKVLSRFTHQRERAEEVAAIAAKYPAVSTIVATHYQNTSQLAFYLPHRWVVTCAGSLLGSRLSNYDEWPETSLYGEGQRGKDMLLIGSNADDWNAALRFDTITEVQSGYFVGTNFQGSRAHAAPAGAPQ